MISITKSELLIYLILLACSLLVVKDMGAAKTATNGFAALFHLIWPLALIIGCVFVGLWVYDHRDN